MIIGLVPLTLGFAVCLAWILRRFRLSTLDALELATKLDMTRPTSARTHPSCASTPSSATPRSRGRSSCRPLARTSESAVDPRPRHGRRVGSGRTHAPTVARRGRRGVTDAQRRRRCGLAPPAESRTVACPPARRGAAYAVPRTRREFAVRGRIGVNTDDNPSRVRYSSRSTWTTSPTSPPV